MRRIALLPVAVVMLAGVARHAAGDAAPVYVSTIPPGYRDWRLVSVAREEGQLDDIRDIPGNDVAIKTYREGKLPAGLDESNVRVAGVEEILADGPVHMIEEIL